MDGLPFEARVRSLHQAWLERRESWVLSRTHDVDSQRLVLANVHRWASECIEDVRHVYGETLPLTIEPLGERDCFDVAIGASQCATFELVDRRNGERPSWQVVARVVTRGDEDAQAADERRVRRWGRAQVEEILLSLLGAYERSLTPEFSG